MEGEQICVKYLHADLFSFWLGDSWLGGDVKLQYLFIGGSLLSCMIMYAMSNNLYEYRLQSFSAASRINLRKTSWDRFVTCVSIFVMPCCQQVTAMEFRVGYPEFIKEQDKVDEYYTSVSMCNYYVRKRVLTIMYYDNIFITI